MTGAGNEINFEAFGARDAADEMANAVITMRNTITEVITTVDAAKGGWQGDAYDACGRACSAFEDEADRVRAILEEIADMVGEGNKGYEVLEAENQDYFTNLV